MIILQCSGQKGGFGFGFPAGRLCWMRTKVSQEWITEKPSMRSAANVSYQLRRFDRVKTQSRLPPQCELFSVQHGVRRCEDLFVKICTLMTISYECIALAG
jgi:hypothetical protein